MRRFYFFFLALITLLGTSIVNAQDVPTGLVRIKSARTNYYLSTATSGVATTTVNAINGTDIDKIYAQVWVLEQNGDGYTFRSANTGEYLQSDYTAPAAGSQTLYIRTSPNASDTKALFNISSDSGFGGKFLNTNTGHGLFSYNFDAGCDWYIETTDKFTEDEIRQRFAEQSGFVGELSEDKTYRIVSYYGRALTDGAKTGDDLRTMPIDADNIAQYWRLKKDGNGWRIQAVLSENYLLRQTTTSAFYHTTTEANITQFNLAVKFNIKPTADKWDYKWTIFYGSDTQGLHDASSQSHGVVLWSTNADASVWGFQEAEVSQEAIDAARQGQQNFEELVANLSQYNATLANLFEDNACTTLKAEIAALSDDELAANADYAALNADMQAMVKKIKNNTWQTFKNGSFKAGYEKFFRIADYKPYSNYQTMCNGSNFTMSNSFGKLSGPTGIVADKGDIIYVYVDAKQKFGATLQLEAVKTDGVPGNNATGEVTTLKQGLNLLQFNEQRMLYIFYQVTSPATLLANFPDIKIHIEGGKLNGYWDATRGMTDDDWVLLQRDLLKASPVLNLKTERLVFCMNADLVKQCEPQNMEGLMRIWDKIVENEERYMGVEDFEGRYRNVWNVFSIDYNYMFATTYGTYYNESTLPTIMNYDNMRKGGNLWGPSHEIGHNHQASINVIGATESSNNLFSNINIFEQGITASRRDGPTENFNQLIANTPWVQRDIWLTTSMYFQLYLYFHAQHHDDNFLPNLFRKMRANPINKSGDGSKDYLHLAKMICDVAEADLSEFFEAYGMFEPVSNVEVDDYATYYVTTTQTQINAAKKYMQKYPTKLGNIMFIDDRVITHPVITDNIFEAIASGDRVPISDETKNQFLMKTPNSPYVGGDYTLYTADATASDDDYYVLSSSGKQITFKGTNYAGHKFYDAEGNLIWATNARVVALPQKVIDLGIKNVTIKTAYYDMSDAVCTDTPTAIRDVRTGDILDGKNVYDMTGRRVANPARGGLYIINGKKAIVK